MAEETGSALADYTERYAIIYSSVGYTAAIRESSANSTRTVNLRTNDSASASIAG